MDLETVYSMKTVLLILLTLICILCGAGLCAYGLTRLRRSVLAFASAAALLSVLSLPVLGILVLVSPSAFTQASFAAVLEAAVVFVYIPHLFLLYKVWQSGGGWKMIWGYGLTLFIHTIFTVSLLKSKTAINMDLYFGFVLDLICLGLFLLLGRHVLFRELSPFSIGRLMAEHDDAIIISDIGGRLLEANKQAYRLMPYLEEQICFSDFTDAACRTEIVLTLPDGCRNFQLSSSQVKDKKARIRAAVITLRDITEMTLLERELNQKRNELEIMNRKLRDYLNAAEKLLEEEQKSKMIGEIQDTIGLRVEQLLTELDSALALTDQEQITILSEKCRSILNDVRIVVHRLKE